MHTSQLDDGHNGSWDINVPVNPFSAKPIFGEKRKKKKDFPRNFIATLVFMLERKILSSFFFSQLTGIVVSALAWHSLGREIESHPRVRERFPLNTP